MRLVLVAASVAFLSLSSVAPAASATLHTMRLTPDGVRFHAIDTATGALTPGAVPVWGPSVNDFARSGDRIFATYEAVPCQESSALKFTSFDPATGTSGPIAERAKLNGVNLLVRAAGGFASDGTSMYVAYRAGDAGCGNLNRLARLAEDGSVSDVRVFPESVDLDRIVFTPDGRLLSLDTDNGNGQTSLYEVDVAALTVTLLGTHANSEATGVYRDLEFAADGTLWGLERTNTTTLERLRQIDPATGAIGVVHELPTGGGSFFRGLVRFPDGATPASAASWGRIKGVYR
jgi:hypothetical protein